MPEMDKLQILIQWLGVNIDLNVDGVDARKSANLRGDGGKKTVSLNEAEAQLLQIFRETDIRGKRVLLSLAKTLMQAETI